MTTRVQVLEQHYSVKDAAQVLSCSIRTIRAAIREGVDSRGHRGLHPVAYVGSSPRIPASALKRWSGAATFFSESPGTSGVNHE